MCGARYKTRPGLTYHMAHSHNKAPPEEEVEPPQPSPKIIPPQESQFSIYWFIVFDCVFLVLCLFKCPTLPILLLPSLLFRLSPSNQVNPASSVLFFHLIAFILYLCSESPLSICTIYFLCFVVICVSGLSN